MSTSHIRDRLSKRENEVVTIIILNPVRRTHLSKSWILQVVKCSAPHTHLVTSSLTPAPAQPPVRPTLASSRPAHWPGGSADEIEASDWSSGRDESQLFAGRYCGRGTRLPPPPLIPSTHCCCHYATTAQGRQQRHASVSNWLARRKQANRQTKLASKQANKTTNMQMIGTCNAYVSNWLGHNKQLKKQFEKIKI